MALVLKPMSILGCLAGTACLIGIPASLHSQKRLQTNLIGGEGRQHIMNKFLLSTHNHSSGRAEAGEVFDANEEDFLTFEELGNNINYGYLEKQTIKNEFSWNEKLKKSLQTDGSLDKLGSVEAQDWKSCDISKPEKKESFCGYLELQNSLGRKYKIRISKFPESKGRVTVIKPKDQDIEYGDENANSGTEKLGISFEKLSTFKNSRQGNGEDVEEVSFIA